MSQPELSDIGYVGNALTPEGVKFFNDSSVDVHYG